MRTPRRALSRQTMAAVLSIGALAIALSACQSLTFPDSAPTLEGVVVGVGNTVPFGGDRTIWVKATPESPCGVVFAVVSGTDIGERQPDDTIEDRAFENLIVGQQVRIWSSAVAESCPGQAEAEAIEIMFVIASG